MKARELLADLVAINTVSHLPNVDLIDYIARYLAHHGVGSTIVPSPDGQKASLYATIGPSAPGGIILSDIPMWFRPRPTDGARRRSR